METKQTRLLLIEDNPADAKYLRMLLKDSVGHQFVIEQATTLADGLQLIQQSAVDVLLLDLSLPDAQGLDAFRQVHALYPFLPIVVLTGLDDELMAVEAVQSGAQDYIVKGQIQGQWFSRAIRYAIERNLSEIRIHKLNEELEKRVIELATTNSKLDALNKSLILARDEAIQASSYKSEFVAKMSHEIRTPVSAVLGLAELLRDTNLSGEQEELVEIIQDSVHSLLEILNDVLDLSKVEAGKVELKLVDVSLVDLVEGTADLFAPSAAKQGVLLMTYVDPVIPPRLEGDSLRLRQILLNLVSNALKFTDEGEVVIRATLESEDERSVSIRFAVTDTGIGIADDALGSLFQPFVQSGSARRKTPGGTGLGLSISKRLVELMGGQIGVESRLGKGTNLWFSVRLNRVNSDTSADELQLPATAKQYIGARILIVDDNSSERGIINNYLKAAGFHIGIAASLEEAFDMLRHAEKMNDPYMAAIIGISADFNKPSRLALEIEQDPTLFPLPIIQIADKATKQVSAQKGEDTTLLPLSRPVKQVQLIKVLVEAFDIRSKEIELLAGLRDPSSKRAKDLVTQLNKLPEKVLVAEDNRVLQRVIEHQLTKIGFAVRVVNNGREVLEALEQEDFVLIFMDCLMPEMDGLESTRCIRKAEEGTMRHIPIVALTAVVAPEDRETCFLAGMDDFLEKPASANQLQQVLKKWLPKDATLPNK